MASKLQSFFERTKVEVTDTLDATHDPICVNTEMSSLGSVAEPLYTQSARSGSAKRLATRTWLRPTYILIDLLSVFVSGLVAMWLRFLYGFPNAQTHLLHRSRALPHNFPLSQYVAFLLLYAALVLLCCQSQDLYRTLRTRTTFSESISVFKAIFVSALVFSAFIYLAGAHVLSRMVVCITVVLTGLALIIWRFCKRKLMISRLARGIGERNALIVGAGRIGKALAHQLEENKTLGFRFVGFLDSNHHNEPKLIGKIEDLPHIARSQFVDEVFITIPSQRELVKSITLEAQSHRMTVNVIPDLYDGIGWEAPIRYVGKFPVMELHWEPIPALGLFVKRLMDVAISSFVLMCSAPFLTAIALAIRLDSPGKSLYRAPRVGQKGRKFVCYKFRTMDKDADTLKEQLRHLNERVGPTFKISNDPRVTKIGKFLRKYSLDELPQLWNVLRGDMSIVGPRPHPIDDYNQYSSEHLRRLTVRPGITGLWQVTAREDPSFATNMKLDLEYIENWDLRLDIEILLKTFRAVYKGSGA